MSVSTKLFVTCGKDKLFEVVNAVVKQLNTFVRQELDIYYKEHTDALGRGHFLRSGDYKAQSENWTNGTSIVAQNMDAISVILGLGEENKRRLTILPDCSSDTEYYCEESIIFSLGHWGKNEAIMNQVAIAVEQFGNVYYDHNDCDGEDYIEVFDFSESSSQFDNKE